VLNSQNLNVLPTPGLHVFENKVINSVLNRLPRKYWNTLNLAITFFSPRTIGSPIKFSFRGFTLKEYDLRNIDDKLLKAYLDFCYPADELPNREHDIEIDKQYWLSTSTFIVTRNSDMRIVGCMQYVLKTPGVKLPVEYAQVVSEAGETHINSKPLDELPKGSLAEFYRCRRAMDINYSESMIVLPMLLKAGIAKAFQTKTDFCVLSFDKENRHLKRLYKEKLDFVECNVSLTYNSCPKKWELLYASSRHWDKESAAASKGHFYLMLFFRNNLKLQTVSTKGTAIPVLNMGNDILFLETVTTRRTAKRFSKSEELFVSSHER
jgi:hypothetical protein